MLSRAFQYDGDIFLIRNYLLNLINERKKKMPLLCVILNRNGEKIQPGPGSQSK